MSTSWSYVFLMGEGNVETISRRKNKTKKLPSGAKMMSRHCRALTFSALENANTCRNAKWIGPFVFCFLYSPLFFVFFEFSGTAENKYMLCSYLFSVAPNTSTNTKRMDPPKIQRPPKGKPTKKNKRVHPLGVSRCIWLLGF